MTAWTTDELTRIEQAEELEMAPLGGDGAPRTARPVWVVRDGDDLYVRSYRGSAGAWYQTARASHAAHIDSGGVSKDVTLAETTDTTLNDRVDAAYRAKYGRYGESYLVPMLAVRDTTLKLTPR